MRMEGNSVVDTGRLGGATGETIQAWKAMGFPSLHSFGRWRKAIRTRLWPLTVDARQPE